MDRTSKLVFARIYRKATKLAASAFLKVLVRTVPYRIHTILTDNGVQFVDRYQGVSQTWIGHMRIPGSSRAVFRFDRAQHSDVISRSIPI